MLSDDFTLLLAVLFLGSSLSCCSIRHEPIMSFLAIWLALSIVIGIFVCRLFAVSGTPGDSSTRLKRVIGEDTVRMLIVLIIGLALTGCSLYDPPEKPTELASEMLPREWCGEARMLFENPYLDADTKLAVLEEMRSRRCPA